jgi:hypothetical protein
MNINVENNHKDDHTSFSAVEPRAGIQIVNVCQKPVILDMDWENFIKGQRNNFIIKGGQTPPKNFTKG